MKKRKLLTDQNFDVLSDKRVSLYPTCDATVWLRSCVEEVRTPIPGETCGTIPKWLNGSLLRNGPGSLTVGEMQLDHLFDSAALLHKFNIKDGKVTYQCRFVQSDWYKLNMAAKRIVVTSYGTKTVPDPCHTIFQRFASYFQEDVMNDNTNISIYPLGDEFFTFTECPIIQKINIDTLETVGKVDVRKYTGIINHTSHPLIMRDGTVFNMGMSVKNNVTQYNVICFPNGPRKFENAHVVATTPARWRFNPSYMHTFAITDNYFIVVEQPLSISIIESVKAKLFKRPLASIFKWFKNECTMFYVICRRSGKRKFAFKAAAFFYLHVINAYEANDHIVVDICCYRDPSVLDCMYIDAMKNMQQTANYANMFRSRPLRFVLPTYALASDENNAEPQQSNWTTFLRNAMRCPTHLNKNNGNAFDSQMKYKDLGENLVKLSGSQAEAYRLSDRSVFCVPECLCDLGCETPRINDKYNLGKKYRYFYAIGSDVDARSTGALIKVDVDTKTVLKWNECNCYPSEPIFVPAPKSKREDDGIILSTIIWGNGQTNRVGLLILCARTFKELGRCEFKTPGPVPKCLHGWFNATNACS